jgi:hypothetical protein
MYIQQKPHLLVFAKHDGCIEEFLFAVPYDIEVRKGDVILVDTMRGPAVATATTEMFEGMDIDEVAQKFGAYLPLKEVKQVAGRQIQEYLRRKTIGNICDVIQEGLR